MSKEAMKLALEALEDVQYYGWGQTERDYDARTAAITALREALAEQPAQQEPVFWTRKQWGMDREFCEKPFTTDWEPLYTSPPAQQEPVAWLTEERYAEMHTSKWTPKIQQVFSKDGILESQTIQYAPQSKPVPYPLAQRTWLGLTDEDVPHGTKLYTSPPTLSLAQLDIERLTALVRAQQITIDKLEAQQEHVAFLANGTRFKISYDSRQSGGQIHGIPPELGGRWVAFVAADDDCHLKLTSPPAQRTWVDLTDEEIMAIGRGLGAKCRLGGNPNIDFDYARAIEAKLRSKNT